jgi:hypothetical protein
VGEIPGLLYFPKEYSMSQNITKRVQLAIQPANLAQAFALMGLTVEQNADLRLFGGYQQRVTVKIPSTVLEKIGFAPTAFSDGIGLDFQDGQIVWVYDHYNQVHIDGLTQYIEALNAIGAQAESLSALTAQGYTFEPVFDLGKQEIGIRAVAPETPHSENLWGEGEQGGGLW